MRKTNRKRIAAKILTIVYITRARIKSRGLQLRIILNTSLNLLRKITNIKPKPINVTKIFNISENLLYITNKIN